MLLAVVVKINYISNMENNKDYSNEVLAVEVTTTQKKKLVNVVVKNFLLLCLIKEV